MPPDPKVTFVLAHQAAELGADREATEFFARHLAVRQGRAIGNADAVAFLRTFPVNVVMNAFGAASDNMPSSGSGGERWRDAAKRATERHQGLGQARPWAVYTLKDELVVIPETDFDGHPRRKFHPTRRVIVVQARQWAVGADPLTVLVVPCTAHFRGEPGPWAFPIPDGEPGFTEEDVVALIGLV